MPTRSSATRSTTTAGTASRRRTRCISCTSPSGGTTTLDLSKATGQFTVDWFDPRNGGALKKGSVTTVKGGAAVALGTPPDNPDEDWLAVVRRRLTMRLRMRPGCALLPAFSALTAFGGFDLAAQDHVGQYAQSDIVKGSRGVCGALRVVSRAQRQQYRDRQSGTRAGSGSRRQTTT